MSEFFQWSSRFGLGVASMDQEHMKLIELMNTLHTLNANNVGAAKLKPALDAFVKFTLKHFADEEAYMESIEFPGLRNHQSIHKQLISRVEEYAAEFRSTGSLSAGFFNFLKLWLSGHICGIDVKYAAHAQQPKSG